MTTPKSSSAYPASMLRALERALEDGEFFIPCPPESGVKPASLRLQFYGLGRALRREDRPELFDSLTLTLANEPPGVLIRLRDSGPLDALIQTALARDLPLSEAAPAFDSPESILKRILDGGDK